MFNDKTVISLRNKFQQHISCSFFIKKMVNKEKVFCRLLNCLQGAPHVEVGLTALSGVLIPIVTIATQSHVGIATG